MKSVYLMLLFCSLIAFSQNSIAQPPCNGNGGGNGNGNGGGIGNGNGNGRPPGGGRPPCVPPPCVPIDQGLVFLLTGGVILGFYAYKKFNPLEKDIENIG